MSANPYVADIMMFGGNFAPRGWAFCDGQLLAVVSNSALFSLLGTTYGGDGRTTFGLPDLRGRFAINSGGNSTGPGLPKFTLGAKSGAERLTITKNNMPNIPVNLTLQGSDAVGTAASPVNNYFAESSESLAVYNTPSNAEMATGSVVANVSGGGQPFPIQQPFTCVNFCISLFGAYPSRT